MLVSAAQDESAICIHISPPSRASLPPASSHPSRVHSALNWAPCVIQQLPTSYLFYRWMDKDMVHICNGIFVVVAVQSLSHVWLCHLMDRSTPGFPVLHHLLELAQKHVHWVGDTIQSSHPLSSPSTPTFNLCQHQGIFQRVSSHQVTKVLELQHKSSEYSELISFKTDWFDLLAVQGTLKSLLQNHSLKASILRL